MAEDEGLGVLLAVVIVQLWDVEVPVVDVCVCVFERMCAWACLCVCVCAYMCVCVSMFMCCVFVCVLHKLERALEHLTRCPRASM